MRLNKKFALGIFSISVLLILLYYLRIGNQKVMELEQKVREYDNAASKNSASLEILVSNFKGLASQLKSIDHNNFKSKEKILNLLDTKFNAQQRLLDLFNISIVNHLAANSLGKNVKSVKYMAATDVGLCDDPRPGNKKVISYSLFGPKAEYLSRFIKDVEKEAKGISPYDTFSIRIYYGKTLSKKTRDEIKEQCPNVRFCDIRKVPRYGDLSAHIGTVWRFVPFADETLDVFCVRDLDSPLLQRGGDAVNEWLSTNNLMHVMRDRTQHFIPVMGGMWCFRPSASGGRGKSFLKKILAKSALQDLSTRADQTLLESIVWPRVQGTILQHDAYFCTRFKGSKPFPTQRREYYVGCVRDCWVYGKEECPVECRPADHKDWIYC